MPDIRKELDAYFSAHEEEMLEDLRRLVQIPSLRGEALPGKPFGEEPARVLEEALRIAQGYGFIVRNHENYVGTAELNEGEPVLGILAHLDVMPAGVGWTCPPFDVTKRGDLILGRGTSDDKGPAVAALYAMRAVKEICPDLPGNVRLILGTDEESGCEDIAYYLRKQAPPPAVFTPDADFPVINVEKGRFMPTFGMRWDRPSDGILPRVIKIRGGERFNAVPHEAMAVLRGIDSADVSAAALETEKRTGIRFELAQTDGGTREAAGADVRVTAAGKSAHGSLPENGNNALTALLELLCDLPLADSPATRAVRGLHEMFPHGDTKGASLGIACSDDISGALSLNFSICNLDEEGFTAGYDCRAPICADQPAIIRTVSDRLAAFGAAFIDEGAVPPHHTPEDTPFVQTLLKVYRDYTGKEAQCLSTGGGTYVHGIEGGVAFGCQMPGVDCRMHDADEFAVWSDLILSAKMFAQVIADMASA